MIGIPPSLRCSLAVAASPALNQFDDREGYRINNIFAGPGGKPCVTTLEDGTYYIQDVREIGRRSLIQPGGTESTTRQEKPGYTSEGEVVLLAPSALAPQLPYGSDSTSLSKTRCDTSKYAIKQMTPWVGQTLWDAADGLGLGSLVGGDSHCFFELLTPGESPKPYNLLWYDRDHGRNPA